ncbi:hypothetical protein DL96DRAFT_1609165 [Flagelloscypha sp. PMI_526]|nr:hypothetical protein DL96DRAFT_1609165 [Flagelloscypha sp. PMI_526]
MTARPASLARPTPCASRELRSPSQGKRTDHSFLSSFPLFHLSQPMHHLRDVPLDVAREIIELAGLTHRETLLSLSLVSQQIYNWIEPILYGVLRLSTWRKITLFARTVAAKTPYGRAIIHNHASIVEFGSELTLRDLLSLSDPSAQSFYVVLEAVKNARSIWFSHVMERFLYMTSDSKVVAQLQAMAPRRLHLSSNSFIFKQMILAPRCLRNMTHLHIPYDFIHPDSEVDVQATISKLPHLQYILLSVTTGYPSVAFPACLKLAQSLVETDQLLLRLCGLVVGAFRAQALRNMVDESGCDSRIVVIVAQDEPHLDSVGSCYSRPDLFEVGETLVVQRSMRTKRGCLTGNRVTNLH